MLDDLEQFKNCIVHLDEDCIFNSLEKLIKYVSSEDILRKAIEAMEILGEKFSNGEIYIPELVYAAEIFEKIVNKIKPYLKVEMRGKGRIVIGTVEGDIHSLGKNLVTTMLRIAGFEVIDLGVDVPCEKFIRAIEEYKPDVLGMSALMTTTMINQRKVIEELRRRGLRDKVKIIVGGAPVTEKWAREIGADAYARDAFEAVRRISELIEKD